MSLNTSYKYTIAGCTAILLWSMIVGLLRNVTEQLGPIGGAAMIYSVGSLFLVIVMGLPKLRIFSLRYLLIGGVLFISYEMCLSLALGMANSRNQAIEMSIINYLWPSLTVLFSVLASNKPVNKIIYPSILLSFFGVAWTLSGDSGLSITQLLNNAESNPVSYSLALIGAFLWAIYCNITKKLANGKNAITWFFIGTAIALWCKYTISNESAIVMTSNATIDLLLAGIIMGSGYALWNIGIIGGNMVLLATFSYFTPVLSTFFSAWILDIELTNQFWQGVMMVTIASLLCWWFTKENVDVK
ncbi:inner membrane protein [Aliivibrio wodanis]|uniref:Inner membrane protein n=1 Tax=Aliivibrio wodanis TaxID=80852 RepID=A0A090I7U3_9GAMM|nr:inner membrane protein [Aliivibrio wodanis]